MQPGSVAAYPYPFKRQVIVTASRALTTLDLNGLIVVNSLGGAVTITLPPANTIRAGGFFQILALTGDVNSVTIVVQGADTYNIGLVVPIVLDQQAQPLIVIGRENATAWYIPAAVGSEVTPANVFAGFLNSTPVISNVSFTSIPLTQQFPPNATFYTHVNGTAEVTVVQAGRYAVGFEGSAVNLNNSRTTAFWGIRRQGVGDTIIPGTTQFSYHRNVTAGQGSASAGQSVDLAAGDRLSVVAQRNAGAGSLVAFLSGAGLTIQKVG